MGSKKKTSNGVAQVLQLLDTKDISNSMQFWCIQSMPMDVDQEITHT